MIIGSLFGAWHWNKSNRSSRIAESQSNRADAHLARLTGMIDALLAEIESPAQAGLVTADQRKRLNEILDMQRALINEESDDTASFRNTLRAYSRSTSVYAALGEYERCVQLAREAHKWLGRPDQWKTRDPSIDTDVLELVFDLHLEEMEALDRSNQPAKATEIVDWLGETLDQFRDLFSESEYLYYRLVFVNRRGLAYRSMNWPTKALNCHVEGQRLGRLLEDTTGPNVDTTVAIASNLINLASRYGDSFLIEKASETKAEAVQILNDAIAEAPSDYSLLRLRAMARSNWVSDLIRLGRLEDAKCQLDLAISEFKSLVSQVPGNMSYLESLAVAILRAASLANRLNEPSQALRYCQSAIDLKESGLDNTLKGERILVSAWDQKSYLQFSARQFEAATQSSQAAVQLGSVAFYDEPDFVDGFYVLNVARYQYLRALSETKDLESFSQQLPIAINETEQLVQQNLAASRLSPLRKRQAWALWENHSSLLQHERWDEAMEAAEAFANLESGPPELGKCHFFDAAKAMAKTVDTWSAKQAMRETEFASAQNQILDYLELAIRKNGFDDRDVLMSRGYWKSTIHAHPRFEEVLALIGE